MTRGKRLALNGVQGRLRIACGLVLLASLLVCGAIIPTKVSAVVAVPTGIYTDDQWQWDAGQQRYEVDSSSQIIDQEQWELPVEGGKWQESGGQFYTTGKYYAYADLTRVAMGNVSNQYWNTRFSVAGDFTAESGKSLSEGSSTQGLKGKYYIYFGDNDANNHYAFHVDDASGLSTSFNSDKTTVYSATSSPFGSAIDVTNEGQQVFNENSSLNQYLTARTLYDPNNGIYDIDVRFDYLNSGIDLGLIDYFYVGVAVSNPSSPDLLFINDQTNDPKGDTIEYDTLRIRDPQNPRNNPNYVLFTADGDNIPEPSSYALILGFFGLACAASRRRR